MFDNIGSKIKTLAKVCCVIEIIGCVIGGITCISIDEALAGIGIALILGGSLLSYVGSFALYGFGQLVDNSDIIAERYKQEIIRKKKSVDKERKSKIASKINDSSFDDSEYIDFPCPNCEETISFIKSDIKNNRFLECPMCGEEFETKQVFK